MPDLLDIILPLAASPWIYVAVAVFVIIDGVFPLFPSEAVVVGLAALASSSGMPNGLLLLLAAVSGAVLGDNAAFVVGRLLRRTRLDLRRCGLLAGMLDWTSRGLKQRPGTFILIARFIPMARLTVNLTAGLEGFSYFRFLPLCVMASIGWGTYNVAIGFAAGQWFGDNPLLGMCIAIASAMSLGWMVDFVIGRFRARAGLNR
tara:strand:- start:231 stop:839 length:609 start_codon:yes stop_codon:yes gene_type:complete